MSSLSTFKQSLKSSSGFNPSASFNVAPAPAPKIKILKKLSSLGPIEPEKQIAEIKPETIREKSDRLPEVRFPYIKTLITPNPPDIIFLNQLSPTKKFQTPKKIESITNFKIDFDRGFLIVGEGQNIKEYNLESINSSSSKTLKSISKSEAQELANVYLKLKIPPQQKKDVFIRAIRNKINLPEE